MIDYGLSFVSTGLCTGCDDCQESLTDNPDMVDDGFFSWRQCEGCGSTLGGLRYAAHGRDRCGDLVHFDVCVDCLFEINGLELEAG